jgi:formylglycine-generating enzyme required for sulfatase activity
MNPASRLWGSAILVALCVPCVLTGQTPAQAKHGRKALLLGVSHYPGLAEVPTAHADLDLVGDGLQSLDFKISRFENFTVQQFRKTFSDFVASVTEGDDVLVYFTGLALHEEKEGGDNFLLPVDFDLKSQGRRSSLTLLIQDLEDRKAAAKMIFVDGARAVSKLGESAGLIAPQEQISETLVVFSQQYRRGLPELAPGTRTTPFAEAVADALKKPGLTIMRLAEQVSVTTTNQSRGTIQPAVAMQAFSTITYLREPATTVVERVVEKPVLVEKQAPLEAGTAKELNKSGVFFVWIPAGDFQMGCVPADRECLDREKPRHKVRIDPGFWIAKTETTAKSFNDFARATGEKMPRPTRTNKDWLLKANPVTLVSWETAQNYCKWLTPSGRLPTEAEWEYAARGGKDGTIYPWGDSIDHDFANYFGTAKGKRDQWDETTSAPVGSFDPNGWGLMDVAGNVREWVADWFSSDYSQAAALNPAGPKQGDAKSGHVLRGGDYNEKATALRLSAREESKVDADNRTGFRCVITAWPK